MKKTILMLSILTIASLGAVLPLAPTTDIVIKKNKFTAITFPFDIVSLDKSYFMSMDKEEDDITGQDVAAIAPLPTENSDILNGQKLPEPNQMPQAAAPQSGPILIKQDKRLISIFPKKLGTTELVVYGNKNYPMHINLIVKDKSAEDHFNFVDKGGVTTAYISEPDKSKEEINNVKEFEMVEHEEVVSKLIKHAYNDSTPEGYTTQSANKSYKRSGLNFKLMKKTIGETYEIDTWYIKNTADGVVNLYPEMFYSDGIYAVSFVNPKIAYGEATKMFIVKKP